MLEIEPCLDSFDGKNVDENHNFDYPVITKAHKKKEKKMKRKNNFTLQHNKVIDDFSVKEEKMKHLVNCDLRCNLCFKTHFPLSKFCRWSEKKNSKQLFVKEQPTNICEDTLNLVKKKIKYLED